MLISIIHLLRQAAKFHEHSIAENQGKRNVFMFFWQMKISGEIPCIHFQSDRNGQKSTELSVFSAKRFQNGKERKAGGMDEKGRFFHPRSEGVLMQQVLNSASEAGFRTFFAEISGSVSKMEKREKQVELIAPAGISIMTVKQNTNSHRR